MCNKVVFVTPQGHPGHRAASTTTSSHVWGQRLRIQTSIIVTLNVHPPLLDILMPILQNICCFQAWNQNGNLQLNTAFCFWEGLSKISTDVQK